VTLLPADFLSSHTIGRSFARFASYGIEPGFFYLARWRSSAPFARVIMRRDALIRTNNILVVLDVVCE
jgi:hypothetical protein